MSAVQLTPAQRNKREIGKLKKEAKADQSRLRQQQRQMEQQRRSFDQSLRGLNKNREEDRKRFHGSIKGLQGDLKASEERRRKELDKLNHELSEQIDQVHSKLSSEIDDLRDFTETSIDQILNVVDQHDSQILSINQEIQEIHNKEQANISTAQHQLNYIRDYIEELQNQFPDHDRLEPGVLNGIQSNITNVDAHIQNAPAAGIAICHQAINDLSQLERDLIVESKKFDILLSSTLAELSKLKKACEENSLEIYDKSFNVNDWSAKDLERLEEEVDRLSGDLESKKDVISIGQLDRLSQLILEKGHELEVIYERTRLKIIAARDRILIGKQIREILKDNGHYQVLGEKGNEDNALWGSYWIKLKTSTNPSAGELDIIIEPDYGDPDHIQHKIILNSHDLDRVRLSNRMTEIKSILSRNGIQCGGTDCIHEDHIKISEEDIKRIVQPGNEGLSDDIRDKLGIPHV